MLSTRLPLISPNIPMWFMSHMCCFVLQRQRIGETMEGSDATGTRVQLTASWEADSAWHVRSERCRPLVTSADSDSLATRLIAD